MTDPPTKRSRPAARASNNASRPPLAATEAPEESAVVVTSQSGERDCVVITGICGRMGRLLARQLHRTVPVVGIDRRAFPDRPRDVVHYQFDLRRKKTRDVLRQSNVRAVVHLGVMHNLRQSDRDHHTWNVVGFQKLLEYVTQYSVPKLVVLSSGMLYGPSPENPHFLTEDAPLLGAQDFVQIRDLIEVDMLAQSFFWKNPGVETVILRPCHILGRVRNAPSNYLRLPRPVTLLGFDPMMQVIHERDVVDAIILALQAGKRGIFNLRGPGEVPLSRALRLLGKSSLPVPFTLAKSLMGRLWRFRMTDYPVAELQYLRYLCMVDDTRARTELGFPPQRDLQKTLEAVLSAR